MLLHEQLSQLSDGAAAMEATDDISLLKAIATQRDSDAFSELYERYHKRAFSFAFHILRNSALADDAVQEAMLSIWLSTKPETPNDAEDWIMRIVMNKSIKLLRGQRRSAKREERVAMAQSQSDTAADRVEGNELIAILRTQIERLPELERTLLACSYCTSMPQREIAEMIGVSHTTISNKIQQALERLRMGLSKAGVVAVVPLLSRGNLFKAMTTGYECPPSTAASVLQRITNDGEKAARALSRRAPAVGHAGWVLPAGIVFTLAAGLGGAWWLSQQQSAPRAQSTQTDTSKTNVTPIAKIDDKPIQARWSFEKGAAADLKVLLGVWQWQSTSANSGQMVVAGGSGKEKTLVALPLELPAHPVVINLKCNAVTPTIAYGMHWMVNDNPLVPRREWNKRVSTDSTSSPARFSLAIYLSDRYAVCQTYGQISFVNEFRAPYPSRSIALSFLGLNIEEIEVHSVRPGEADFLKNMPQVIADLGVEPIEYDERGNVVKQAEKK